MTPHLLVAGGGLNNGLPSPAFSLLDLPPGFNDNDPGLGPEVDRIAGCRGMMNAIIITAAIAFIITAAIWWFA